LGRGEGPPCDGTIFGVAQGPAGGGARGGAAAAARAEGRRAGGRRGEHRGEDKAKPAGTQRAREREDLAGCAVLRGLTCAVARSVARSST
jgi:hypothetical protein